MSYDLRLRILSMLLVAGFGTALPVRAQNQTGVIAFRDDCTGLLYAIRADGSGRIALPLPPLPLPADDYDQVLVLDVTTSGPLTVVYFVEISRIVVINGQNVSVTVDHGLFAVHVDDQGGVLTSEAPVRLLLPEFAGVDPNRSRYASFSPMEAGDRLALVSHNATESVLMTAQVDRDAASRITGLSDLVLVGDLLSIGVPDPLFPNSTGFTGDIDYSPTGSSIVAAIYFDLWEIQLAADDAYLSVERLTENSSGYAEWNPSYSPDESRIAYTRGRVNGSGGVVRGVRNPDIYSLTSDTHVVLQVTNNQNKGKAADLRNNAMWSQDSAWIGFTAYTKSSPHPSQCPSVNSEIFRIKADGSSNAAQITTTNGTGAEAWPGWGW